jgi:dTDP-L-rhamnose 4-epimerase
MARALVTGGAGFIGSHTVDALLERGFDVRILDLLVPPVHDGNVPDYVPEDAEFIRGDVRDRDTMRQALRDVNVVFHMAAYQDYLPDFSTFFTTNSAGTALLYELILAECRTVEHVVVASSQAVYGEGKYECREHGAIYPGPRNEDQLQRGEWEVKCPDCDGQLALGWTDESRMNPHNSYGWSKRDQDDIALQLGKRYSIPSVTLRYSIVQGPRQSFRNAYSGALRSFTAQVGSGAAPVVYEDGRQIRDYVGIRDVVNANMIAMEDPKALYRPFNVGGDRSVTVVELAEEVRRAVESDVEPDLRGLYRVGDTRHIRSDVSALQGLGWAVEDSVADVVTEYVQWALSDPTFRNAAVEAQERMRSLGVLRSSASVQAP